MARSDSAVEPIVMVNYPALRNDLFGDAVRGTYVGCWSWGCCGRCRQLGAGVGAVRSTELFGPFVVDGCGCRAVGVGVVCWMIEGALVVPGLGSHGKIERR